MGLHRGNRVFIVTTTLPMTFGGRTKSLLQRARILSEAGFEVSICSTNHNDNYQDIFESYRARGFVDERTVIRNMFEDLAGSSSDLEGTVQRFLTRLLRGESGHQYRHASGKYEAPSELAIKYLDGAGGPIEHIDYITAGIPHRRVRAFVNLRQNVTRLRYSDVATGRVLYQHYLDREARPYMQFVHEDGKKFFARVDAAGGLGPLISFKKLISEYFEGLLARGDAVICDARGLDYSVRLVQKPVRKIYVMHNPHLENPLDLSSGIKKSFRGILRSEGLGANETIVSLTEEQRSNVLMYRPGLEKSIAVVGHVGRPVRLRWRLGAAPRRVGIIGRLDEQKNLRDAIEAFGIFFSRHPGYVLDIYGRGKQEAVLRQAVDELQLSERVVFHGFTEDVNSAFQSVAFTLNTSLYEGFPLAIIESISNGTPVASYPVNFGPERILGGVAGRVSKERTPASLAEEMSALANSPPSRRSVRARSKEFSKDKFLAKWIELLK